MNLPALISSPPFSWVLRASLQASVLVALVLLIQFTFRRHLSARFRANLWLIVLLRLLIPYLPQSPLSLFNLQHFLPSPPAPASLAVPGSQVRSAIVLSPRLNLDPPPKPPQAPMPQVFIHREIENQNSKIENPRQSPIGLWQSAIAALPFLYLLIVAILSLRIAVATFRLSLTVRRLAPFTDPRLIRVLDQCRLQMRIGRPVALLAAPTLCAPALMGFFRPRILLPPDLLTCLTPRELRLVFLHELAHIRRHDVAVNWLATAVRILHFFNPVVHFAFARLRTDRELACDELVLRQTRSDERHAYGQTILKLLQTLSRPNVVPGMVGILEGSHLTRRITMIARFDIARRRFSALAIGIALLLTAVALTDAVRGQGVVPTTRPAKSTPREPAADSATTGAPATPARRPGAAATPAPQRIIPATPYRMVPGAPGDPRVASAPGRRASASNMFAPASAHTDPEATDKTNELLRKTTIPAVQFASLTLRDALEFIRDATGANFYVDWPQMEEQGITPDTTVNLQLKTVSAEDVLRLTLRSASKQLGYSIENGIIVIAPIRQPDSPGIIKAYDVFDLVGESPAPAAPFGGYGPVVPAGKMAELVSLISETVDPSGWFSAGGASIIKPFNQKLLITTSEANHREIEKILAMLREKPDTPARTAPPIAR